MELQQFWIRPAWVSYRKDRRAALWQICTGKHLQSAGDEGLRLRFELRHYFEPSFRLFARPQWTVERGLYSYEYPPLGRRAVFHYRRSAAMGAGTVWRQ